MHDFKKVLPGFVLTANTSTMVCPHGAFILPIPSSPRVLVSSQPAITSTDFCTISGCPFNVGGKPQPCVSVRWMNVSKRILLNGKPALLNDGIGFCQSAEQIVQGTSIMVQTQPRVKGI